MAEPVELSARPVRLRGSALAQTLLRLAGWRVLFDGLPQAQGVAVVYPHTSNWDFVVGVLAKWAIGIPVCFWGKDRLFAVPLFGRWLRWLGGVPVVRHKPQGAVAHMIRQMREAKASNQFLWLAVAPEGTRRRAEGWRLGAYRVAHQAGVPLALVKFDFAQRQIGFDSFWHLCGDMPADFAVMAARLAHCRGCRPELASPIRPLLK